MNGRAPGPWEMEVQQPPPFAPTTLYQEVPHTASVQLCNYCHGTGHNRCINCLGMGHVTCNGCGGYGGRGETCRSCQGSGRQRCYTCHGCGRVTCHICKGIGKLKVYLRLKVEWEVKLGQHVLERTDLPNELITQASGTTIFAQEFPRVFPLTSFFEPEINQASENLINTHAGFSQTGILHCQRHDLRSVPVNEVHCLWKDKSYRFWVYGTEHKVHCPDYPQQCCCGCVIL